MKNQNAISPSREKDFPMWYQEVVKAADLAEHSPVRGAMVIKPWGYGIWEKMQKDLDRRFKETGHQNAYFPLFIPLSYLEKEAAHIEGFAKECAVVTHHRLEKGADGKLIPAGELEEPLIVRPTSELIIGASYSKWVESYRDLPILINQWANVVRWEMRPRIFLRTTEFLWQEGHTVHATKEEALAEAQAMHEVYTRFCSDVLGIPVIKGEKSEGERFPGAEKSYTIEAMMQDGKALQAGTSHFLGQNFAKASNIQFRDKNGDEVYAWTTSWGTTTRLIGALVMSHGDDDGLVLPPAISPIQVVILPMLNKKEYQDAVLEAAKKLKNSLESVEFRGEKISVLIDDSDKRGGEKMWGWIKKGVPIRIEVGPRDLEKGVFCLSQRTEKHKDVQFLSFEECIDTIASTLEGIQNKIYERALHFREKHTHEIHTLEEFESFFSQKIGGFASLPFSGDVQVEKEIQKKYGVTVRCIPTDTHASKGTCPFTLKQDATRAIFAKSY
ncbi:MAG: proline--tRNA ligase [Simkaniaceae bacterium]